MKDNLVSVIIPTYNAEKYLDKCLNSVITQTYSNIEIVIVDDGSIDRTRDILEHYKSSYKNIKVIYQENQGAGLARKKGLFSSSGTRIMYLDCDDWIDSNSIEVMSENMDKNNSDCVMCGYVREYTYKSILNPLFDKDFSYDINNSEKLVHRKIVGPLDDELRTPHRVDNTVSFCMKLYSRNIAENGMFISEKITGTSEDTIYNLYALQDAKISYVNQCFYHYRKENENSITGHYKENLIKNWDELYKVIWNYVKVSGDRKSLYKQAFFNRVACCTIGLGLNEVSGKCSLKNKIQRIRRMLVKPIYQRAYKKMQIQYCPLVWKIFFILCRNQCYILLTFMLMLINNLRGRE